MSPGRVARERGLRVLRDRYLEELRAKTAMPADTKGADPVRIKVFKIDLAPRPPVGNA